MKTPNGINSRLAFTVMELLLVVTIVCFLFLFVMPSLVRYPGKAFRIQCVNNLKQVGLAFRLWSPGQSEVYPMQYQTNYFDGPSYANDKQMFIYFKSMSNELSNPRVVICPSDTKRAAAKSFTSDFNSRHVSYFIGMDASETNPASLLAGDRHLTTGVNPKSGVLDVTTNQTVNWTKVNHNGEGNILFADGHVEQLSSSKLQQAVANSGMATNRLVFP